MKNNTFDVLLLIARPAAGKSEIIDHLKKTKPLERIRRYHINRIEEIDDFPMLWTWFEEDEILTRLGYPRLHTHSDQRFIGDHLWDLLIERICMEYKKKLGDNPDFHRNHTAILEFARGTEHGGFTRAFQHISLEMAQRMAILYIKVSWEESLRKNRARFNPDRPHTILEHALSDEKLEELYRYLDWEELAAPDPAFINIQGIPVPYVVFENEDDVTSARGEALTNRLENSLGMLWERYKNHRLSK